MSTNYSSFGAPLLESPSGRSDRLRPPVGREDRKSTECRKMAPTRGLLVRDPHASKLLNGEKIWEIRGRATQIRGPVVIIKSGTGRAFGTVNLVRVLGPLSLDDLLEAEQLPLEEREEFRATGLPYKKTFAYVFSNPRWFERPIPYRHPRGAVTWLNLPDIDLSGVAYASTSRRNYQLQLV